MGRVLAALVLGLLLVARVGAQDEAWTEERLSVAVPTRDGASLAADVLLPATSGRYPAVVVQTPYDRTLLRPALRGKGERGPWEREHYAYVLVDWRGFFGSRAAGRAAPGQRGRDGFDVVEWTAAQPWCDGKVGTWGPSALGRVQFDTAMEKPPHLVCCVPLVAPMGQRHEDYYEGGVFKEAHVEKLDALGFGVSRLVRGLSDPNAPGWKIALAAERPSLLDVPMFFITGWYDHATSRTLESFRTLLAKGGPRAREGSKLLVGPWEHMSVDLPRQGDLAYPSASGEAARETRLFFDFHLRGATTNGWATREEARSWQCNEEGWTSADPPPDGVAEFFLRADGTLDVRPPTAEEPPRVYVDDPASPVPTVGGANLPAKHVLPGPRDQTPLLARDDVLVWTSAPLAAPLRLGAVAALNVTLRADRPDVDVAVRLCDVLADGRTMLVADAIQRASWRHAPVRELLEPGKAVEVRVTLPPMAYTWPAGGRIRLVVSGSNWPRFERNPHTGEARFDPASAVPAKVEILRGSLGLPEFATSRPAVKPGASDAK